MVNAIDVADGAMIMSWTIRRVSLANCRLNVTVIKEMGFLKATILKPIEVMTTMAACAVQAALISSLRRCILCSKSSFFMILRLRQRL